MPARSGGHTYGYSVSRDAERSGNGLELKRGGGRKNTCRARLRRSNLSQTILRELSCDGLETRKVAVKGEHGSHKLYTMGDLHHVKVFT